MRVSRIALLAAIAAAGFGLTDAAAQPPTLPAPADATPPQLGLLRLDDLVQMGLARHPKLAEASFAVQAAQGRADQAGRYPNPTVSVTLDEIGDRTGPGGVNTLPLVTQEIVTARKLSLNRAAAMREMTQAELALTAFGFDLMGAVRAGYVDLLTSQRRVALWNEIVGISDQLYKFIEEQRKKPTSPFSELDSIQLRVELSRFRAEQEAAKKERLAAWRRLVTIVGVPDLPTEIEDTLLDKGLLDMKLPAYDFEPRRALLVQMHPDVISAQVGIERAQLVLQRANREPIPNVTVGAGYVRQNQNRSNDVTFQVSVPVPAWNRNQGGRLAAQAEVGKAIRQVSRVQTELSNRLAALHGQYSTSQERMAGYAGLLKDAELGYQRVRAAYEKGQPGFDYLRLLQAQRTLTEARLEYLRALSEAWRAAAELSGLLLEQTWPPSGK